MKLLYKFPHQHFIFGLILCSYHFLNSRYMMHVLQLMHAMDRCGCVRMQGQSSGTNSGFIRNSEWPLIIYLIALIFFINSTHGAASELLGGRPTVSRGLTIAGTIAQQAAQLEPAFLSFFLSLKLLIISWFFKLFLKLCLLCKIFLVFKKSTFL